MIKTVGQTFSTASYKAKNNNQKPSFGFWGSKSKNVKNVKDIVKSTKSITDSLTYGGTKRPTIRSMSELLSNTELTAKEKNKVYKVANKLLDAKG